MSVVQGSFKSKFIYAVIIQSFGTVFSMLLLLLLARLKGPVIQGEFAEVRAWVDLVVVVVSLGLPQAFVYFINKQVVKVPQLLWFSVFYTIVTLFLIVVGNFISIWFGLFKIWHSYEILSILLLSIGTSGMILHGFVRGIFLTMNDGVPFSLMTILPPFLLLILTIVGIRVNLLRFEFIYCLAGSASAIFAMLVMKKHISVNDKNELRIPVFDIFLNGFWGFLQSIFLALQPVWAFWELRHLGALGSIGYFTVGLYVYQAFATPLSMVAPILFNRWCARVEGGLLEHVSRISLKLGLWIFLASLAAILPLGWVVHILFGDKYELSVRIGSILLTAAAPLCYTRIMTPAIHAAGSPQSNAMIALVRIIFAWGLFSFSSWMDLSLLVRMAASWVISEYLTALMTGMTARLLSMKKPQLIS